MKVSQKTVRRLILPKHLPHGVGDLPQSCVGFHSGQDVGHEVVGTGSGIGESGQGVIGLRLVAPAAQRLQPADLPLNHFGINPQDLRHWSLLVHVLVDTNHDALPRLDLALQLIGRVLNLALGVAQFDGPQRPSQFVDLVDVVLRALLDLLGHALHEVTAGQWVHAVRHPRLVGDDLLGSQGDLHRLLGGQPQRLVVGVGVERLGAAQHRRQRLHRHANDVVLRLLGRQGDACGLGCGSATS